MLDGEILSAAPYNQLLASSKEFRNLVDAHKETAGSRRLPEATSYHRHETSTREIRKADSEKSSKTSGGDQLIKQEVREIGDTGFRPYIQYLNQNKGFLIFFLAFLSHLSFVIGQILQNSWMAANVDDPNVSTLKLIAVYLVIGFISTFFLLSRSLSTVFLGLRSSKSLFSQLLSSLFRAPMSFYDSTPLGRILSRVIILIMRSNPFFFGNNMSGSKHVPHCFFLIILQVSVDLSIVDLDIPFSLVFAVGATTNFYSNLSVLAVVTWQILFVAIPLVFLAIRLQVISQV